MIEEYKIFLKIYILYKLNIKAQGKNLPLIYALLPDKQGPTYLRFFKLLLDGFNEDQLPKKFMHDFEKGLLNAIIECMPLVIILGCYFHFCQNLWKHMQKKGLSKPYINNIEIRKYYKYLKALCFVPCEDVIEAFTLIQSTAPNSFLPMCTHLENYYIGKPKRNCPGVRAVPIYPIPMWNCYERVLNDDERTNNSVESWHKVFEACFNIHLNIHFQNYNFNLTKGRCWKTSYC